MCSNVSKNHFLDSSVLNIIFNASVVSKCLYQRFNLCAVTLVKTESIDVVIDDIGKVTQIAVICTVTVSDVEDVE